MPEINIRENDPRRNGPPTTTNISGNGQYIDKKHRQWNGKKNIHSNRHEILLCQRHNTTKSFPHILGKLEEKPSGLCRKKTPNLAPYKNETKIF